MDFFTLFHTAKACGLRDWSLVILLSAKIDAEWVFRRYQEIRHRLPVATFPPSPVSVSGGQALSGDFDVFIFDSFGVLNIGERPVAGAGVAIDALRRAGKQVRVLTNAASLPRSENTKRFANMGYDFADTEIVTSRMVLSEALSEYDPGMLWAVVAPEASLIDELPCRVMPLAGTALDQADGFIMLSSHGWTQRCQDELAAALRSRPRPLLIGNADIAAPREDGFSLQTGAWAHDLADTLGIAPRFFGKPYADIFKAVLSLLPAGITPDRILMLGDTLHTDILGAAAMCMKTALVTDHGVLGGMDINVCIAESGICPDYILPSL